MIRLQKVLADRGVASRRHAEELIAAGRVRVDGVAVWELGTKVGPDARIDVDGRAVGAAQRHRYVALYKPRGVVSSARAERGRASVADLVDIRRPFGPRIDAPLSRTRSGRQSRTLGRSSSVGARERLYPVGRLDVDSEGLVLLTNDGEWAERVLHPRHGHEREYEVDVAGALTEEALARLRRGVRLEDGLARAERVSAVARGTNGGRLRLVLRTGWKRQIRRMCAHVGLRVVRLVRVRIGPLSLGRLRPGTWRELAPREVRALAASPRAGAA